jgi:hypothetical protein
MSDMSNGQRRAVLLKQHGECRVATGTLIDVDLDAVVRGGGRVEDRVDLGGHWLLIISDPGGIVVLQQNSNVSGKLSDILR